MKRLESMWARPFTFEVEITNVVVYEVAARRHSTLKLIHQDWAHNGPSDYFSPEHQWFDEECSGEAYMKAFARYAVLGDSVGQSVIYIQGQRVCTFDYRVLTD